MALTDSSVYEPHTPGERSSARQPKLSRVAWIPGEKMDYRSWVREGGRIGSLARGSAWWLGDWLHYGTEKWGERYAKAAKVTGYDPKTLRNMRYVASRFDLSLRRDNLTWSHHALLASLTPKEQAYWLERAVNESFSVEDLRMELRRLQKQQGAEGPHPRSPGRVSHPVVVGAEEGSGELLCPKCGYQLNVEGVDA